MRTALNAALVDLLGATRSRVVDLLRPGPLSVAELAERLGLTEAAVRRHVQALEREGFVDATTVIASSPPVASSPAGVAAQPARTRTDAAARPSRITERRFEVMPRL